MKNTNRDFKGVWIPKALIKQFNIITAVHLAAIYFNAPFDKDRDQVIRKLKYKGLLIDTEITSEDIKQRLENKGCDGFGIGDETCEWCKIKTVTLHNHHYPIERQFGGLDTVKICPNCHQEFHSLKTKYKFKFRNDIQELFDCFSEEIE